MSGFGWIGTSLRHLFLWLYFCICLYIHGLCEMLSQPFVNVRLDDKRLREDKLSGKVALVTGGTNGIGLALCKILLSCDVTVIAAALHPFTPEDITDEMRNSLTTGKLTYISLDLASFHSIEKVVGELSDTQNSLDFLINNAGVMLVPEQKTEQGFEMHMGINFIGHAYLTKLLLPKLKESSTQHNYAHVVNVASSVHRIAPISLLMSGKFFYNLPFYSPHLAYSLSKQAVILYTEALANQLSKLTPYVKSNAVHPGVVSSSLYRHVFFPLRLVQQILFAPYFFRTPEQGAYSIINCLLHSVSPNGSYLENGVHTILNVSTTEKEKLWQMVGKLIHKAKCRD